MKSFDFNHLFILDLANNHQGDLEHGLQIIRAMGKVVAKHGVRAGLKFQFRELDTYIHPDFRDKQEPKHIPRFLGTRLKDAEYDRLADEVRTQGMLTISTPFDEASVDLIDQLNIEIIKIASCSASDWPLLEKVADRNRPVILSTAGLSLEQIEQVVSFFEFRNVDFSLMHCVAIYPTPTDKLQLNQIDVLKSLFPGIPVGWSTHENQNDLTPVQMAYAKGARLFERHVGVPTDKYPLNAYSSTPQQVDQWFEAHQTAVKACGGERRFPAPPEEVKSLASLMRGVYAKTDVAKGEAFTAEKIFFAMPIQKGQLKSGQWRESLLADRDYQTGELIDQIVANSKMTDQEIIYRVMLQAKGMLNAARIFIGPGSSIEISHHYGLARFREFGCILIDCVNRSYCKKLVVMLPRQKHPYHYHEQKEETFQLLHGDLEVELNGQPVKLVPGEQTLVPQSSWHKFHTLDGAIFEEVSTTAFNNDSYYEDERISRLPRDRRKTKIPNWQTIVRNYLQHTAWL